MTQPSSRPPNLLQPRPKGAPTFSSSSLAATASTTPQTSRASSRTREPNTERPPPPVDTSDEATASLIRRILCPHTQNTGDRNEGRPISELLPPLTSSDEVDLQLYAIVAIIIKEFVYSWYAKITPDHVFVEEVVRIIAHCTRALEERLRRVDFEELILDEIPALVDRHVHAYRNAHEPLQPPPLQPEPRQVYHMLCPHPALSPIPDPEVAATVIEQQQNEAAYCTLLVQGVLAVLLPSEDLENACLPTLITDVLGEMILLNGIGRKACEDWFVWECVTKIAEAVKARLEPKPSGEEVERDSRSRLENFGLLPTNEDSNAGQPAQRSIITYVSTILWGVLQYGYLAFVAVRFITLGLYAASWMPSSTSLLANPLNRSSNASATVKHKEAPNIESSRRPKRPIITIGIWSLASNLVDLADRMPWLTGSLSFLQYQLLNGVGRVGATEGLLDKFLHQSITSHILHTDAPSLSTTILPALILTLRTALFPHNTLAPRSPSPSRSPSPLERLDVKSKTSTALLALFPASLLQRFFNTADGDVMRREVEERILDCFGDAWMNKRLLYGVVECVVLRVVPEMAVGEGVEGAERSMK